MPRVRLFIFMFTFITDMFKGGSGSALGIDVGSSAIKVVQLKKEGGKAVLETYGSLALGPYVDKEIGQSVQLTEDKRAEALRDILREAETTTQACGVAIPFQSSLMSVVEMPTDDEKRLEEMVPIEARKYIPAPISEVSLDWMIIPSERESRRPGELAEDSSREKVEVLLVAIHNEVVNSYQHLIKRAELEAHFYEIEIFSTIRSVAPEADGSTLIFDMGASNTKLYLVQRGVVHSSHTINRGSQDVTAAIARAFDVEFAEAEKIKRGRGVIDSNAQQQMKEVVSSSLGHIFADSERVVEQFESKYHEEIERVYLVGGGSTLQGLQELTQKRLRTDVELGHAFGQIETPAFLEDVLRETGPEFTVAAGVALRKLNEDS